MEDRTPDASVKPPAHFKTWLLAAVLTLGTIVLYWRVTHYDFTDFDDNRYVTSNIHVQNGLTAESIEWAFCNPVSGNWHPLTILSHMADCQLYGLRPGGHHLTNLLLHTLNTLLLFLLLLRLTGNLWPSAFAAALFAWHPLHVESVAWIAERKDVLSACFGFLALLCYVRHARRPTASPGNVTMFYRSPFYWLALLWFALGLMSKPMLVTLPCVMMLLDYQPLARFQPGQLRALIIEKLPFFAIAAASCVITYAVQSGAGATRSMEVFPFGLRCENALISYCRYLLNIFWPHDLAVFYPYPSSWPPGLFLLSAAFLCALTALFWVKRRSSPVLLAGWLWFLGTLVPVIGLVQVGKQCMADRYTYIPSIGVFAMVVWGACKFSNRWRFCTITLSTVGSAVLISCCALTHQQLGYWQNSETLFHHALAVTADNEVARNNLGIALLTQGRTNNAMDEFKRAVQISPNSFEAHENIGDILAKQGSADAAIAEYQETIRLKPEYADPHNNLGILYATQGRISDAIAQYQEAIRLNPEFADAHYNLGKLLAQQGRSEDAANEFQAVLRLQPNDVVARNELAQLLARSGQSETSIGQLQAAVQASPNDAELHFKLGNLLARNHRPDDAISEFQAAISLKPDFAEAHSNLGNLLSAKGRIDDAIAQFQEAIRLKPDYRDAHYNLANALLKLGRIEEAASQYERTIQLSPDFAPAHNYLGICLIRQGHTDDAIAQFQETLRLRPNYPEAATNLTHALEIKNQPH